MKKIIYSLLIALASGMAITSCTEEEVRPTSQYNGGGSGSDPVR